MSEPHLLNGAVITGTRVGDTSALGKFVCQNSTKKPIREFLDWSNNSSKLFPKRMEKRSFCCCSTLLCDWWIWRGFCRRQQRRRRRRRRAVSLLSLPLSLSGSALFYHSISPVPLILRLPASLFPLSIRDCSLPLCADDRDIIRRLNAMPALNNVLLGSLPSPSDCGLLHTRSTRTSFT